MVSLWLSKLEARCCCGIKLEIVVRNTCSLAHRGYRFGNVHDDPVCLELSLRDSPATMVTPWKTIDEQSVAHGAAEPADLTKQHRFPRPGERGRYFDQSTGTVNAN